MLEATAAQQLLAIADQAGVSRPQRQRAGGVGEARTGDREAVLLDTRRRRGIGSQENLERRAVADLGVQLAGRAEGGDDAVSGVLLECLGNLLHRRGKVGGDRDLHLVGQRQRVDTQAGDGGDEQRQTHGISLAVDGD